MGIGFSVYLTSQLLIFFPSCFQEQSRIFRLRELAFILTDSYWRHGRWRIGHVRYSGYTDTPFISRTTHPHAVRCSGTSDRALLGVRTSPVLSGHSQRDDRRNIGNTRVSTENYGGKRTYSCSELKLMVFFTGRSDLATTPHYNHNILRSYRISISVTMIRRHLTATPPLYEPTSFFISPIRRTSHTMMVIYLPLLYIIRISTL